MGDTVHIRTTPDVAINDYVKGQKLNYETPEPNIVDLLIDKGKSWSFKDDDVDKKQADYAYIEDWTRDASEQLKIQIDLAILATSYASASANNSGLTAGVRSGSYNLGVAGTPLAIDKTNVVEVIQDCSSVLTEQDAPLQGRWLVLPEWMCNLIGKSDLKDASLSGDETSMIRNGRVGMIGNFMIYQSNQLPTSASGGHTATEITFGHISALTFASQLLENEGPLRHPDYFGDFYRGLQVYGWKVIKEEAMGHLHAYKG